MYGEERQPRRRPPIRAPINQPPCLEQCVSHQITNNSPVTPASTARQLHRVVLSPVPLVDTLSFVFSSLQSSSWPAQKIPAPSPSPRPRITHRTSRHYPRRQLYPSVPRSSPQCSISLRSPSTTTTPHPRHLRGTLLAHLGSNPRRESPHGQLARPASTLAQRRSLSSTSD